jgi:small-conductance mechanosensitive channel
MKSDLFMGYVLTALGSGSFRGDSVKGDTVGSAADSVVGVISKGFDSIFSQPSKLDYILLHGALFILLTFLLVFLIRFLNRFTIRLHGFVRRNRGVIIRSVRIKNLELVSADQLATIAFKSVRILRWAVIIFLVYLYLTLAFSLFVWTELVAQKLLGYVLSPLVGIAKAVISYLPNVFYIAVVVVVARYVLKLMKLIFSKIEDKTITIPGFPEEWAKPTFRIATFLLIVFVLVIIFPYLPGSESAAAKGVSIFLAVLLSLGSSSAISNIIAGVVITYMRSFKVGDRVKINDITGDIIEHNFLITRIKTVKNEEITMPNSLVLSGHVTNYTAIVRDGNPLILYTSVTIGYDAPWPKVHELLIAAALATENVLHYPQPFVLQTALDDFYVSYQINAYTNSPSMMQFIYSALHQNIQDKFFEAGVEIASPHYYSIRDGNRTTMPDKFLEDGYTAPPFKVRMEQNGKPG